MSMASEKYVRSVRLYMRRRGRPGARDTRILAEKRLEEFMDTIERFMKEYVGGWTFRGEEYVAPKKHKARPGERLFSPPEAAAYLGVPEGTLGTWRTRRRDIIPFERRGGRVWYSQSALDDFKNLHCSEKPARRGNCCTNQPGA